MILNFMKACLLIVLLVFALRGFSQESPAKDDSLMRGNNLENFDLMPSQGQTVGIYPTSLSIRGYNDIIQSIASENNYKLNPKLLKFSSDVQLLLNKRVQCSQKECFIPVINNSGVVLPIMHQQFMSTRSEYMLFQKKGFSFSIGAELLVPNVGY